MTTQEDIRFITRYYESLRGLIYLPFAAFIILMATQEFFPSPLWQQGDCTITLPLFIAGTLSILPINRYYRKRYGSVQVARPGQFVMYAAIAVVSIFLSGWLDAKVLTGWPVSLYVLVTAAWMFAAGIHPRRWYYRVFAAILLALAFFPALQNRLEPQHYRSLFNGLFNLIFGLGFGIMRILDHLLLTRLLRPAQEAPNAQS